MHTYEFDDQQTLRQGDAIHAIGGVPSPRDDQARQTIALVIRDNAYQRLQPLGETTFNRNGDLTGKLLRTVVAPGDILFQEVPELEETYKGQLRELFSEKFGEEAIPVHPREACTAIVTSPRYGVTLETHVDVWEMNGVERIKSAEQTELDTPDTRPRGTIIGHPEHTTHDEVHASPLAIIPTKLGSLTLLRTTGLPHAPSVPITDVSLTPFDFDLDQAFWETATLHLNWSYTTKRQQNNGGPPPNTQSPDWASPNVLGL